jgi:hypothetical protein
MKNLLPVLLTLISLIANAQQKAAFEVHFSPNFTDQTKKLSDNKGKMGYGFGVLLALPLKEQKWEGILGLELSTFGSKNEIDDIRWGTQHNGNGGFDPNAPSGEALSGVKIKHNFFYFQLPLGLRYYLSHQKIKVFLQPALAPAMYLTAQTKTVYLMNDGPNESTSSWGGNFITRKYNLFARLGIGLAIPLGEKTGLNIQPHGGIQLLSTAPNSSTGARLYSAGLDVAFRYRFY